ncbi:DUF2514 family protein [Azonexus sp. IMCC34839]|uniref:DUF2514 family protein n=1 Tax=Azonexus sp. IMCC34839 TaxID=3133695 RepID=UPI003999E5DE
MNPLNLIPDKYLLAVKLSAIALAMALAAVWWNSHNAGQQQIGYDRAMGEVAAEQKKIAEAKRLKEIEDQNKANKEAKRAQDQLNDLERQRDSARADADRMRQQYRQAGERGREAISCASGAGKVEPGSDPVGVLTELLIRADARAEEVAGYADRLRVAGIACERTYDAIASSNPD